MKDWFYANNSDMVSPDNNISKSKLILTIKNGYKTIPDIEQKLNMKFSEPEYNDVNYFIRVYAPMSYDNQSGCQGCDGCMPSSCAKK